MLKLGVRWKTVRWAACSLSVVFQEESVDFQGTKQLLGDWVVATVGLPAAAVITPANVETDGDALLSQARHRSVISRYGFIQFSFQVHALCRQFSANAIPAKAGAVVGRIKLDVLNPVANRRFGLRFDKSRKVRLHDGTGFVEPVRCTFLEATKTQHGCRRHGYLYRTRRVLFHERYFLPGKPAFGFESA